MTKRTRIAPHDVCWYACLRPDELERQVAQAPVAFVPWGALEWHSVHLPVGLDGIVAEAIAARIAERTGGVVLPAFYLPIAALPHRFSLTFRATTVRAALDDLLAELARAGFRVVVILAGHHERGHEMVLIEAAEDAFTQHHLLVLATPPLAVVDPALLDHAGRWETSALLATEPQLVDLRQLQWALRAYPAGRLSELGIQGELPLAAASAGAGEVVLERAVITIARLVSALLASDDPAPLQEYYAGRRAEHQDYVQRYFTGSWEEAAERWWTDILQSEHSHTSAAGSR